jgi:hypothetical protein
MRKENISPPIFQHKQYISGDFFESRIFYLISSRKLFYKEFWISAKLYRCSSQFYGPTNTEECSSIFSNIICRMTYIFMSSFLRISILIRDKYTTTSRSWVSSSSSIAIDYKFHTIKIWKHDKKTKRRNLQNSKNNDKVYKIYSLFFLLCL